jgi:membrane-associated protease RseP (regulator of RpoE activity)
MDASTDTSAPVRPRTSFFAKDRTWLNVVLLVLTIGSVFLVGLTWSASFLYEEKYAADPEFRLPTGLLGDPRVVRLSLVYAFVLMAILLAHEMGHYLTCRKYGLSATLPFFIPAPSLIGTLGAFIKIRSPITRKRRLFDIGAAGPLAGFAVALPAVVIGLALSKIVPVSPSEETIIFGEPLLFKFAGLFLFKGFVPGMSVSFHPVAFAGWVGVLVTSLNLLPLGQLDGGHIVYAIFGSKARTITRIALIALLAMGLIFWAGWLIWFFLLLIMGLKHPPVWDEGSPLGLKRTILAVVIAVIFVLSFIPAPVQGYNIFQMVKMFGP